MQATLINSFLTLTTLATATGLFLHDTRLDKAASIASLPLSAVSTETGAKLVHTSPNDFHTHIERTSVGHAASFFHSTTPGMAPRVSEDKKHLMQRHVGRGHHAFDNYNLPLL